MAGAGSGNDGNDGDTPVGGPPADEPTPTPERDPRRIVAKHAYEMGQPLRTVGAQAGVSEATVRTWAKEEGWVKGTRPTKSINPAHRKPTAPPPATNVVRLHAVESARTSQTGSQNPPHDAKLEPESCEVANPGNDPPLDELFRQRVRELLTTPTRDEAADVAARAVVQVVMVHREKANRLAGIVDRIASQLEIAADSRELLESLIIDETQPGKRRAAMLRMVSLPAHATTIKDLATAFQKLTLLERQAFGLGIADDPTPPAPPQEAQPVLHSEFDRIRERVRLRLAQSSEPGA